MHHESGPSGKLSGTGKMGQPAKMETGITVQVPPFVTKGEKIKIDTAEGTYMERA